MRQREAGFRADLSRRLAEWLRAHGSEQVLRVCLPQASAAIDARFQMRAGASSDIE